MVYGTAGTPFSIEARDQSAPCGSGGAPVELKFSAWRRTAPGDPMEQFSGPLHQATLVDGARYEALFDRIVTVSLAEPRHLDGGAGGRYFVDGVDAGPGWNGAINTGTTPAITVAFSPPPGSVFLEWNDGERENPREVRPEGAVRVAGPLQTAALIRRTAIGSAAEPAADRGPGWK